uniref:Sema domain, immunoglobulin domain (Ig), short basic domain, secreted, (semaphorin) 3E n=1 Tax=Astyanax mexicanus TaxID=7994 RepID=A0A8B9JJQ3_ASTMX
MMSLLMLLFCFLCVELWDLNRTWVFQAAEGVLQHYSMLLDETHERLIIGGKDTLYSLNLDRVSALHREIHWDSSEDQVEECLMQGREKPECANYIKLIQQFNSTHLLACGTGAFSPMCFLLYTTTQLQTEVGDREQLNGEKKNNLYLTKKATCQCNADNDHGGQRMLVNKWSSFLKARLICSVAGPNGIDTHFDELGKKGYILWQFLTSSLLFSILFSTAVFKGYAVCMYSMEEIRAVFNGPFAHRERSDHHWSVYEGKVPYPRPGSCASKINGGQFSSSKEYPDEVLRFVRSHPLMFQSVQPVHRRPILLDTDGRRRLTELAVDRVEAEDGHYNVLFIGTDDSVVLKVITIFNKEANTVEEVLLEELQVFKVPVTITEIIISTKRQQLYVGSELGVAQVRVHQCGLYGSACADCCLARDPYCAWDGHTCSRYYPAGIYTKRRFRRQDVRHGNAVQQCNGLQLNGSFERTEKLVYGVEKNSTLLECRPRSLQAVLILTEGIKTMNEHMWSYVLNKKR